MLKSLKSYLYKIDVATDPFSECNKEQPKVETFEHLLCDCPLLDETRKAAMSEPVKPHHLVSEPERTRQILAAKLKDLDLQEHDLGNEECEAPAEGSRNVGIAHM